MIQFIVPLPPRAKGRPRFWNGRVLTDKATRAYEREFARIASTHKPAHALAGPLAVNLLFQIQKPKTVKRDLPSVRPDVDNFAKAAMDALSAFWVDDAQVVELTASKRYGPFPMIRVEIHGL